MKVIDWDGGQITKPGLYSGIPLDSYHAGDICDGPSISSSGLRAIFSKSPAHYYAESPLNTDDDDDDDDEKKAESEALIFGSAAHWLILGEDNFTARYVMRPVKAPDGEAWNGNKTICKKWIADQVDQGRVVLTPKQIRAIRGMARSLAREPLVQAGCLNGSVELSLFWKDKETGVWLKSRPDTIPFDSADVVDLKTSAKFGDDLDKGIFWDYRYDMQGELCRWGLREVLGVEMASFTLIFVEKKKPYSVEAVTISSDDLDSAGTDLRVALKAFKFCFDTGNWFGPAGTQNDARFASKSEWAGKRQAWQRSMLEREMARPQIEQGNS